MAASHIVQIYDNDAFLSAAVGYFAAEGLRRGEAVLLTGTKPHLEAVEQALRGHGIEPRAIVAEGRLTLTDAHDGVAAILEDGMPDAQRLQAAVGDALARVCADSRFSGVRWWGELSNLLQLQGNMAAALAAEDLAEAMVKDHGIKLFCSYLCDRFDPRGYDDFLPAVCARHSHGIPAENYVAHRLAVNRALADVIGEIKGPLLQSLMSWKGLACDLPSSQALLFWIREAMPEHLEAILVRAKAYQQELTPLPCGAAHAA